MRTSQSKRRGPRNPKRQTGVLFPEEGQRWVLPQNTQEQGGHFSEDKQWGDFSILATFQEPGASDKAQHCQLFFHFNPLMDHNAFWSMMGSSVQDRFQPLRRITVVFF